MGGLRSVGVCFGLLVCAAGCGGNGATPGGGASGTGGSSGGGNVSIHEAGPYRICAEAGVGTIAATAVRPRSNEIAVATSGGFVLFFSTEADRRTAPPVFTSGAAVSVGYSADGAQLMIAGEGAVSLLDASTHQTSWTGSFFSGRQLGAALSPDATLVAISGMDVESSSATLKLVRAADRRVVATVPIGSALPLQFTSDGKALLIDQMMVSVPSLAPESDIAFSGGAASLSPDGALVATDHGVYARATGQQVRPMPAYANDGQAFSPDGRFLAELANGAIHLISTSDWTEVKTAKLGTDTTFAAPAGLFYSSDGQHLLLGIPSDTQSLTGDIVVFEEVGVSRLKTERLLSDVRLFQGIVFSPDASLVADVAGVWRTSDLTRVSHLPEMGLGAFQGDGRLVNFDRVYDPQSGKQIGTTQRALSGVSPDGTLGVTLNGVGEDVIRLVDGARVSHLDAFALTGWIFSNDNRYVAAPSSQAPDGTTRLHVFDVASGTLVTTFDPGGWRSAARQRRATAAASSSRRRCWTTGPAWRRW